jgi:hypothetical protein
VFREFEGLLAPGHSICVVAIEHSHERLERVCNPELPARREPFEDLDCGTARLLRLGVQARLDAGRSQSRKVVALPPAVAELTAERDRFATRFNCVGELAGHGCLVRGRLEEHDPLRGRELLPGMAQSPRVLGRGLAMRAEQGCALGRLRREAQNGLRVPGRLGVVRKSREIQRPVLGACECDEHLLVKSDPPIQRQRFFDGETGELVTKPHATTVAVSIPDARHSSRFVVASPASASRSQRSVC